MQIEIYNLTTTESNITVELFAVCDSFSSLLWDIEYYSCGAFDVYIAASPQNIEIFQTGRIVGRDDDNEHFGIIETVKISTDSENGDYLTVSGRFLTSLLSRRIIYPAFSATNSSCEGIVRSIITLNAISAGVRNIPGLSTGTVTGDCWQKTMSLMVSYENLMDWIYLFCENIGGSLNIRLDGDSMKCDLFQGTDRSIKQAENPHVIFSDSYNNLLSFSYLSDSSVQKNFAYVFGCGEGNSRKRTTCFYNKEPTHLDRYEVYADKGDLSQDEGVSNGEYLTLLKRAGTEELVSPQILSEFTIAAFSTQYKYNADYFVGDYVTVEHKRFGLIQPKIQLIGMIESFDSNGRNLTPTFRED